MTRCQGASPDLCMAMVEDWAAKCARCRLPVCREHEVAGLCEDCRAKMNAAIGGVA